MATELTDAQIQGYVNQALAAGYSQRAINDFFADNGRNDAERLLSALAPSPGSGAAPPTPIYATPTPIAGNPALVPGSPDDGMLILHPALVPDVVGPHITPTSPGAAAPIQVLAAAGVPTWAIVAAAIVLVLVFMERR